MDTRPFLFSDKIGFIRGDDLAVLLCFESANSAFRKFCVMHNITPVPGRRGVYDPKLIRRRLDEAQGLVDAPRNSEAVSRALSLTDQRKARRGAA